MARSYSSYGSGFNPQNGKQGSFERPTITGGPSFNNTLGESVSLGNAYGSLRKSGVGFDKLAATSVANRAAERATATQMEAAAHATGLSTLADVKSNKMIAEAQENAAKAEARGSMMGSAFGAIGSIGGLLLGGIA